MKNYFIIFAFLAILFIGCQEKKETILSDCEAVLIEDCNCLQVYEPVCGCDRVTYSNSCYAECSSISEYQKGECP